MDKEFKVFKEGKGSFELISSKDFTLRHRILTLKKEDHDFDKEDTLWAIEDKDRNQTVNMVVVEEVKTYENEPDIVELIVRNADRSFIKNMRVFNKGEIFTLVATFRTVLNERRD